MLIQRPRSADEIAPLHALVAELTQYLTQYNEPTDIATYIQKVESSLSETKSDDYNALTICHILLAYLYRDLSDISTADQHLERAKQHYEKVTTETEDLAKVFAHWFRIQEYSSLLEFRAIAKAKKIARHDYSRAEGDLVQAFEDCCKEKSATSDNYKILFQAWKERARGLSFVHRERALDELFTYIAINPNFYCVDFANAVAVVATPQDQQDLLRLYIMVIINGPESADSKILVEKIITISLDLAAQKKLDIENLGEFIVDLLDNNPKLAWRLCAGLLEINSQNKVYEQYKENWHLYSARAISRCGRKAELAEAEEHFLLSVKELCNATVPIVILYERFNKPKLVLYYSLLFHLAKISEPLSDSTKKYIIDWLEQAEKIFADRSLVNSKTLILLVAISKTVLDESTEKSVANYLATTPLNERYQEVRKKIWNANKLSVNKAPVEEKQEQKSAWLQQVDDLKKEIDENRKNFAKLEKVFLKRQSAKIKHAEAIPAKTRKRKKEASKHNGKQQNASSTPKKTPKQKKRAREKDYAETKESAAGAAVKHHKSTVLPSNAINMNSFWSIKYGHSQEQLTMGSPLEKIVGYILDNYYKDKQKFVVAIRSSLVLWHICTDLAVDKLNLFLIANLFLRIKNVNWQDLFRNFMPRVGCQDNDAINEIVTAFSDPNGEQLSIPIQIIRDFLKLEPLDAKQPLADANQYQVIGGDDASKRKDYIDRLISVQRTFADILKLYPDENTRWAQLNAQDLYSAMDIYYKKMVVRYELRKRGIIGHLALEYIVIEDCAGGITEQVMLTLDRQLCSVPPLAEELHSQFATDGLLLRRLISGKNGQPNFSCVTNEFNRMAARKEALTKLQQTIDAIKRATSLAVVADLMREQKIEPDAEYAPTTWIRQGISITTSSGYGAAVIYRTQQIEEGDQHTYKRNAYSHALINAVAKKQKFDFSRAPTRAKDLGTTSKLNEKYQEMLAAQAGQAEDHGNRYFGLLEFRHNEILRFPTVPEICASEIGTTAKTACDAINIVLEARKWGNHQVGFCRYDKGTLTAVNYQQVLAQAQLVSGTAPVPVVDPLAPLQQRGITLSDPDYDSLNTGHVVDLQCNFSDDGYLPSMSNPLRLEFVYPGKPHLRCSGYVDANHTPVIKITDEKTGDTKTIYDKQQKVRILYNCHQKFRTAYARHQIKYLNHYFKRASIGKYFSIEHDLVAQDNNKYFLRLSYQPIDDIPIAKANLFAVADPVLRLLGITIGVKKDDIIFDKKNKRIKICIRRPGKIDDIIKQLTALQQALKSILTSTGCEEEEKLEADDLKQKVLTAFKKSLQFKDNFKQAYLACHNFSEIYQRLQFQPDFLDPEQKGEFLLRLLLMGKHTDAKQWLHTLGAINIDYQEPPRGYTALHMAVIRDDKELVKLLCQKGADISIRDKTDRCSNPLELALSNQNWEMAQLLAASIREDGSSLVVDMLSAINDCNALLTPIANIEEIYRSMPLKPLAPLSAPSMPAPEDSGEFKAVDPLGFYKQEATYKKELKTWVGGVEAYRAIKPIAALLATAQYFYKYYYPTDKKYAVAFAAMIDLFNLKPSIPELASRDDLIKKPINDFVLEAKKTIKNSDQTLAFYFHQVLKYLLASHIAFSPAILKQFNMTKELHDLDKDLEVLVAMPAELTDDNYVSSRIAIDVYRENRKLQQRVKALNDAIKLRLRYEDQQAAAVLARDEGFHSSTAARSSGSTASDPAVVNPRSVQKIF